MQQLHPAESAAWNFRRVVPKLVSRYFNRGRRLVKEKAPDEELHRFRIRTKRIRYTLELYSGPFPKAAGDSLKSFQKLQQALGNIQDARMFHAWLTENRPADEPQRAPGRRPGLPGRYEFLLAAVDTQRKVLRSQFFREWKALEKSGFEKKLLRRIKKAAG